MDQEEETMGPELREKLGEEWNKLAKDQAATVEFLKTSIRKRIETGHDKFNMVGFFNSKLDINRFFLEDSDGKKATDLQKANSGTSGANGGMPGVEFGTGQTGFADSSDPFENELEEALCVFKSGDGNTDILEKNENLIMFYIDLENECIVNKQSAAEEKKDEDADIQGQHPVLFN